uniref:Uncharacterized protein n=1 Tax=Romanomermis culicivorax TaxID=13658 RepID=A0A915KYS5_ROMCU
MWSLALLSFCVLFATETKDAVTAVVDNSQTITRRKYNFRSLSVDDHNYFDHIDWKDVIETLMDLDCQSDHMQISFRYNTRHARLLGQKLHKITSRLSMKSIIMNENINDHNNNSDIIKNKTECDSIRDDVHSQLTLKVNYCDGCCGMRVDRRSHDWTAYQLSVALSIDNQTAEEFQIKKSFTQTYDLSCSVLPNVNQGTLGSMIITISEDARSLNLYQEHDRVDAYRKIFLQGVFPDLSSSNDVRSLIVVNGKVYEMSSINQSRHQLILSQSFRLAADHDNAEVSMIDSSR